MRLINAEGTLEIAPSIGYADIIADLVSTGITLRDNHLRQIEDGEFLQSQACLIANRQSLQNRPAVLEVARKLLEYIEAHLRAEGSYLVNAIAELRQIGGSGVIVSPCTYIFEEEPERYKAMLKALK